MLIKLNGKEIKSNTEQKSKETFNFNTKQIIIKSNQRRIKTKVVGIQNRSGGNKKWEWYQITAKNQ